MRVWLISDTHWGVRSNSVEWIEIIDNYFETFFFPLIEREYREGDVLLHLGDVFDNRQNINLLVQHSAIKIFERLSKVFEEVNIIVGNHDIYKVRSNDVSSVDCLKYIPRVKIHKTTAARKFGKFKCLLMPWHQEPKDEIETLAKYPGCDYLFCHTEVRGSKFDGRRVIEHGNSLEEFKSFKNVYSGHIHFSQKIGNWQMVGNPYQMTRADSGNTKGIYLLDMEKGTETFFENTVSPRFLRVDLGKHLETNLGSLKQIINNNFVDLYIPSEIALKHPVSPLLSALDGAARRIDPYVSEALNTITDAGDVEFSNLDIFSICENYLDGLDYEKKLKNKLHKTLKELYDECSIEL